MLSGRDKVVAIITSRFNSGRFPGKAVYLIKGKPLLRHVIDNVRLAKGIDDVVVSTTPESPEIIKYCRDNGISYDISPEGDILGAIHQAAHRFNAGIVVRIWGDSPLIQPSSIEQVLRKFTGLVPYVYCDKPGQAVAVFSRKSLDDWEWDITDKEQRYWFHKTIAEACKVDVGDCPAITVDKPEDIKTVEDYLDNLR